MTTYIRVNDSEGEGYDLVDHEDLRITRIMFKNNLPEKLAYLRSLPYNEGDVMICDYPKTGTHWMSNLVDCISSQDPIHSKASTRPNIFEIAPIDVTKSLPSPRTFTTHVNYERLPINYLVNGGKIIFVLRNPKDVEVSFYYFLRSRMGTLISWNAYVTCFLGGLVPYKVYFDYLDDWQTVIKQHPDQIIVVYYEDLKKVRYEMYNNGNVEMSLVMNGTGTTYTDWLFYNRTGPWRALEYPWTDMNETSESWWALNDWDGDVLTGHGRTFRIIMNYGGCPVDNYYTVVLFEPNYNCSYENHPSWPKFLYTTTNMASTFDLEEYGMASVMAVWVYHD